MSIHSLYYASPKRTSTAVEQVSPTRFARPGPRPYVQAPYRQLRPKLFAGTFAPEDFFPANPAPGVVQGDQGAPGTFAMKFTPAVAGNVTGVKWYGATTTSQSVAIYSLGSPGTQLVSQSGITTTLNTWNTYTFGSPIAVTAGTTYVACMYNAQGAFAAIAYSAMGSDFVVGNLTAKASGTGGEFNGLWMFATGLQYPTNADTTVSPKLAVSPVFQAT